MTGKRASTPIHLGSGTETLGLPFDTPLKSSSTSTSTSLNPPEDGPPRKRAKSSESGVTTSNARQDDIQHRLKAELNGAVLYDPGLLDKLSCDDATLDSVFEACQLFDRPSGDWIEPPVTGPETLFYQPIVDILNDIGQAVHSTINDAPPYIPFSVQSNRQLKSTHTGMSTAPDIIKCETIHANDPHIHWHDIDLFVEVKNDSKKVTEAIQQSARYARALFAHRIDRVFVETLVVCGTTATFLHYDRSGLVYSDDVDIYKQAERFIQVVAGLLLARSSGVGYNPIFQIEWAQSEGQPTSLTRRVTIESILYEIVDILCNRKCIRGRATLVLALRRAIFNAGIDANVGDEHDTIDAVLKLLWRDPTRFQERLILEQFIGVYGLCQLQFSTNQPTLDPPVAVHPRRGLVPGRLGNVFGRLDSNVDIPNAQRDDARELSLLLMQPGRPLSAAKDPAELKAAFVGAIMGHWALVNSHVQHRDISLHNILLPYPSFRCKSSEWANYGSPDHHYEFKVPDWLAIFNDPLSPKYKKAENVQMFDPKRRYIMLGRVIEQLGPEPRGFLSDVDLANILSIARNHASDMHTHRTGTLSFMAIDLLLREGQIAHSYLHDLESFFWVLLYTVADHREGTKGLSKQAQDVLNDLNTVYSRQLGNNKQALLFRISAKFLDVASFGTSWAADLAPTIQRFAACIISLSTGDPDAPVDPDSSFEQVLNIFLTSTPGRESSGDLKPGPGIEHQSGLTSEVSSTEVPCTCTAKCHHTGGKRGRDLVE